MAPKISVIIPNLNSPIIGRTLTALRGQQFDLSQVEVLVVGLDQPGLVKADGLVKLISTGAPTSPAVNRNIGIRTARGDTLCFTDADCIPAPDWLACLTAPYADERVHVVGGSVTFDDDDYWVLCDNLSWFYKFLASAPPGGRTHLASLNLSVRREVVETIGLFDERYPRASGEDTEWTVRMRSHGYRLLFEPRAVVRHCAERGSPRQLWQHAHNFGYYSPKINPVPATSLRSFEERFIPRRWWLLLLLIPVLSLMATARVVVTCWAMGEVWKAVPGIWLSKIAWCIGAVQALFRWRESPPCMQEQEER